MHLVVVAERMIMTDFPTILLNVGSIKVNVRWNRLELGRNIFGIHHDVFLLVLLDKFAWEVLIRTLYLGEVKPKIGFVAYIASSSIQKVRESRFIKA